MDDEIDFSIKDVFIIVENIKEEYIAYNCNASYSNFFYVDFIDLADNISEYLLTHKDKLHECFKDKFEKELEEIQMNIEEDDEKLSENNIEIEKALFGDRIIRYLPIFCVAAAYAILKNNK